jgi:predicted dehydrogenase
MGGTVEIGGVRAKDWESVPVTRPYAQSCRGLGVADLAAAIADNRPHRANDEIALHALEIMEALHVSAAEGRHVTLTTTCERPAAMLAGSGEFSDERPAG